MTRRRRRLRDELTPRRRRVETATAAALRAQRRQLSSSPARPASTAPLDRAVRELRALARDLDRRAGRDAQVRAAARGVAELARAYA
ncbi:hypothetical protein Q5424_01385, partial [Conexibacter sp. JD483]|uniref:hypothetical protein n=2 Tax=Conexibacter TaxID=191494 RepID=UPI00286FC839